MTARGGGRREGPSRARRGDPGAERGPSGACGSEPPLQAAAPARGAVSGARGGAARGGRGGREAAAEAANRCPGGGCCGGGSVRSVPLACATGAGTGPLGTPGSAPGWGRCTHRRWEARGEAARGPWVPRGEGSFCERPIGQRAGDSARDLQRDQPGLLLLELQLSGWGSQGLCRWQLKPAAGLCQLMGLSLGAV